MFRALTISDKSLEPRWELGTASEILSILFSTVGIGLTVSLSPAQ